MALLFNIFLPIFNFCAIFINQVNAQWKPVRKLDSAGGHYISDEAKMTDYIKLKEVLKPKKNSRIDFLVQSLITSINIYDLYLQKKGYINALVREEYMKTRFVEEYNNAYKKDKVLPKVILKFGHWHLFKGFSPNTILTTGNFVNDFAKSNGMDAFSLSIWLNGSTEENDLSKIPRLAYLMPLMHKSATFLMLYHVFRQIFIPCFFNINWNSNSYRVFEARLIRLLPLFDPGLGTSALQLR